MNQPNKVPRKITLDLKRHQRLMVGLSWDPLDTKYAPAPENRNAFYLYDVHRAFNFLLHIRSAEKDEDGKGREKDYAHFDLDLICFALDHDETVGACADDEFEFGARARELGRERRPPAVLADDPQSGDGAGRRRLADVERHARAEQGE